MFKWYFIVDMYLHTVQLTSSAPLAIQGASTVSVCRLVVINIPLEIPNFSNYGRTDM